MGLKTFNLDNKIYEEFSKYCKKEGISMSKKVEKFIAEEVNKIKGLGKNAGLKTNERKIGVMKHHSFSKYC